MCRRPWDLVAWKISFPPPISHPAKTSPPRLIQLQKSKLSLSRSNHTGVTIAVFVAFSQCVGAEARDAVGVCAAGGEEEEGSESGDAEGEEGLHFVVGWMMRFEAENFGFFERCRGLRRFCFLQRSREHTFIPSLVEERGCYSNCELKAVERASTSQYEAGQSVDTRPVRPDVATL
ncbi:hypothetical protein HDK90DRAFT_524020 [Phyllosticta capitalensis]|uniref:Uncharacterized protein n=1 Tax=Phyllosticta capitalensis TaxID=121624 RepID=A0ABR1YS23_9PEZI